jgi:phosphoserine phosphatase
LKEILLITLSGKEQPGVCAAMTALLADYGVEVMDIGQAIIHRTLSLGLMIELAENIERDVVVAGLQRKADQLSLQLHVEAITAPAYADWVGAQGQARYIVTLLARKISAEHLARVMAVVSESGLEIENISRLSGRIPQGELPPLSKACVEFSARGELPDEEAFRRHLLEVASELEVDLALQQDNMFRRNRRLVAFDMDSTLIEAEVIDELAKVAGVGEEVSAITESAMRGELDFSQSFRRRVGLLKGLDESALEQIAAELKITEGAAHLISTLNTLGYKTAILSGGFTYFARYLQDKLGIDYIHANELDIVDGKVTGEVTGTIVDGARKAVLLKELATQEGLDMQQVIAVGDGANDLPMLSEAGLGVAFRAKPLVKQSAEQSISILGLDAVLYLLGFADRDHH